MFHARGVASREAVTLFFRVWLIREFGRFGVNDTPACHLIALLDIFKMVSQLFKHAGSFFKAFMRRFYCFKLLFFVKKKEKKISLCYTFRRNIAFYYLMDTEECAIKNTIYRKAYWSRLGTLVYLMNAPLENNESSPLSRTAWQRPFEPVWLWMYTHEGYEGRRATGFLQRGGEALKTDL